MKKYVKYLIITLVVGIMLAIGTYAYWSYESSNKKNISIQTSRELSNYIIYDEGESKFAGELKIGSSYSDGVHTTISIKKTNDASNLELIATVNMTVNAIGDNIKNSYGLKWAITKGDSTSAGTLLNQGNFYGKNNDDVIELKTGIEVTTTEEKYTVWIWIDGSENIDPKIVGETLDTSVWTQVDQILDNRFEVTSINSNYQFINASAVNTTKNIVAYAVTNTSSQPSSYTNLTTQEQGNVYNVVDYKVTNTGTYYVWFKDSAGNTVNESVAVSKIDTTPPVCTFGNFEPSTIKNGETSVVELTCVDEEIGIKSSDITSSSITLNGNSATLNNNIEKTRITNGFKYKLTVTGTSTDGDTSLSLNAGVVNNKAGLSNSTPSSTPTVKVQNITNVAIPIQSGTLTYNSTSQTVTWSNYDSSKMTVSGTTSATNAGTYSATFTLKDTTKYRWPDGTSTAKTVSWTINKYNISNVDVGSISDQTYTGSAITPVPVLSKILNGSSKYTLVKDTDYTLSYSNNTNVGTATITATGKGNFTGTVSTTFKINKASLTVPSQSGTLTYNTASQSPSWSNYNSTKMTVSGTTSATNAGTYSATFTLKDTTNYKWSDGTTAAKTVSWTINKYNISNVDVGSISDKTYTGSAITPVPVLSKILNGSSKYTLVKDTDYTLSYSNNTNVGTATIKATGKGNFTGTKNVTFKIVAKSIAIPSQSGTLTYNKTSQSPSWSNYDSTKMTVSGTTSATNAGTYSATFTLKDTTNYKWSDGTTAAKTVSWKINQYNISNVDVGSISDQTYTGSAITPLPVLSKILNGSSKYTLVKDTDYTLSYSNNTNVGTATITATGKGNFTGTVSTTFKINKASLTVPSQSGTLTYNTASQSPSWSNYNSTKMTVSGTTSATNAGTYSATFTLKDTTNYKWSDGTTTEKTVSWKINKYNISNVDVGSISDQTYTGSAITPVPVLSKILNGSSKYTLVKDTDYTLSYSNNTNVGTATITATGKGNFTGTKNVTFKIVAKSIAIPMQSGTLTYNGTSQTVTWYHYDSSKMTVSGTTSATNAGTYSATFTLKDTTNYRWSEGTSAAITVYWKIDKYNISNVDVGSISDQAYTGSAITPVPVLSKILNGSSKYTLVKDTDYTLSYSNNTNVGTATITATGKGNFTGTKIITFKIVQIKVYQNIFNSFSDYTVSGNNASISYNAGINEYTFNNTSTSDPYAEISQKAYLTANTPYTIHADFKTTDGTKITGSSEIFQIFYSTQSGGYSEDNSVRLSPSNNTITFKPTSTGYYYFRFDNDYGNSMIIYNFSIGFTEDITYGKTYGNLTSGSQIVGSNTELFAGWYTETSYTNKVTSTTTVTNINSHVLFAKWKLYGKFNYWNGSSIASTYSTCELTSGSTCTLSVPSAVSGSTAKNAAAYVNVATGTSSMSAGSLTISDNSQVYYAYYRKGITNHYYTGSTNSNNYTGTAWSTRTLYKNVFFTSDSALSYVISTSQTGTTNLSHGTGMGSAAFKGFSINGSNFNFSSIASAAESTTAYDTLYSVYNIWYNSNNSGYYNSLSDAVSIASSGSTLTLNTSYLEDYKKIVISKKITLNINKTVEFSSNLADIPITLGNSSGTVEAGDLYLSGSGTLKSNNKRTIYNYGGVLQCKSVKFTGSAIHISSTSGTVKLGTSSGTNGCSITKTSTTNNNSAIVIAGGTAYMYAGTIDSAGYGIYVQDAGTVNVYGGSITSTDSAIYSAAGSSGYIRIGRAFSDNTTLNPNGIANTAKNRYSGLKNVPSITNPKIIVDGTGNPAINIYSTSSSENNVRLRINHGYIEAKSTVVSISSNAKNVVYIDGGALYSSNSHVYHNQSTSVVTAFTGGARLYSVGYSTVNSVHTLRINNSYNDVYNGIEESRSDCSDSDDTGLGRYYGTYIMSESSYAINSSNDSGIGVSIGDNTYTQGSKACDKFRNEGATIASYRAVFVGKIDLYWYVGSAYHNSAGSTYYAGSNVTKKTDDKTRLHKKNNAITATTFTKTFNGTDRSVSVNRRSYPYQTELTKAFGSEVTTVTRTSGTLYAWRSGSSCTSFSGCGSGSCNSVGVVKSGWNIYVISKSSYSNLYYAWVPITSNAWGDKYPGYHILAKDGHAAISTCAGLEYPVTFSNYVTTTYNNRTYAKVIMPLKNGSTCYVSDCSNLPS